VYLKDAGLKFGPLGTEDIGSLFRSMTMKLNCNVVQFPDAASGTKVGSVYYGQGAYPMLEVTLVVKGKRGDTIWNYWQNRTECIIDFDLTKDANDSIALAASSIYIDPEAELCSYDESGPILTLPLKFYYNVADGYAWNWTTTNELTAILATT
jgi:hypothetical protein